MTDDEVSTVLPYFEKRGFEVRVEERDLHAELMAAGKPGQASFFAANRTYYSVNLLRGGAVVAERYADGDTFEDALIRAKRRYGSEQG